MKLKVVGSGSSGNMYILTSSTGQNLVLDMGFGFKCLKENIKHDISNVSILSSHQHGDHFNKNGVRDAMKAGVEVYSLREAFEHHGLNNERRAKFIEADIPLQIDEFTIYPFEAKHNVPCVGFVVYHSEMAPLAYITDTYFLDISFEGVGTFLIESNHDADYLEDRVYDGKLHIVLGNRILDDHLSIENCMKMLELQDINCMERIILTHLSSSNSKGLEFVDKVRKKFGRPTQIAVPGLTVDLSQF